MQKHPYLIQQKLGLQVRYAKLCAEFRQRGLLHNLVEEGDLAPAHTDIGPVIER